MKSRLSSLVLGFILLVSVLSNRAEAATPRIPTGMYPTRAHISYVASMSDKQMDCMWSFFCEGGIPIFHLTSEVDLHRQAGWAQFAGWHNNAMTFELFVSRYEDSVNDQGISRSAAAFTDFSSALRMQGYRPYHRLIRIHSVQPIGSSLAEIQYNGPKDIVVVAEWFGVSEIEALTMFTHGSQSARQIALRDLALQVHAAETRP